MEQLTSGREFDKVELLAFLGLGDMRRKVRILPVG